MRYGSVCSGIEAATMAWNPLGWSPAFFSEIEKFPSAVLAHHYGSNMPGEDLPQNGIPNLGDMTKFEEWPDYAIDLLVGGTPCQSFSVAGLRRGLADPRGNLMLTYLAIAARYRPTWLVWENVPGALSVDGGQAFASLIGGMAELGYHAAWRVLDAQYIRVDGYERAVPQRRRRVFVVGYLGDWRRAAAVFLEPESLSGNPPPRREAGKGIAHSAEIGFGGGRCAGPIDVAARLAAHGVRQDFDVETFIASREVAATLTRGAESAGKGGYAGRRQEDDENLVAHSLRGEGFDASEDGTGRGTPIVPVAFNPKAGGNSTIGKSYLDDGSTYTLDTDCTSVAIQSGWAVRRLTPRERERLQGFPDDFTNIPWRGNAEAPDGPRYKALGNSMAVNVMRWIGQRIQMVEDIAAEKMEAAE